MLGVGKKTRDVQPLDAQSSITRFREQIPQRSAINAALPETKLYLDFSEDEIEYVVYFGYYLGTKEIATLDYEIVDGNTSKVRGKK